MEKVSAFGPVIDEKTQTVTFPEPTTVKIPWRSSMDPECPMHLTYSAKSMAGAVEDVARRYPEYTAYEFMGRKTTYAEMWAKVEQTAKSLKAIGVRRGDRVMCCMPNCPQTVSMFYAINLVGAVAVISSVASRANQHRGRNAATIFVSESHKIISFLWFIYINALCTERKCALISILQTLAKRHFIPIIC